MRYSDIRNNWPGPRHAGRPDSWDRRSAPAPARLQRPRRLPKLSKPERASQSPSGQAAAIGHFRLGVEIGIGRAGGVSPGGRRLTLLVGREAAIAGTAAEIAALDAVGKA